MPAVASYATAVSLLRSTTRGLPVRAREALVLTKYSTSTEPPTSLLGAPPVRYLSRQMPPPRLVPHGATESPAPSTHCPGLVPSAPLSGYLFVACSALPLPPRRPKVTVHPYRTVIGRLLCAAAHMFRALPVGSFRGQFVDNDPLRFSPPPPPSDLVLSNFCPPLSRVLDFSHPLSTAPLPLSLCRAVIALFNLSSRRSEPRDLALIELACPTCYIEKLAEPF